MGRSHDRTRRIHHLVVRTVTPRNCDVGCGSALVRAPVPTPPSDGASASPARAAAVAAARAVACVIAAAIVVGRGLPNPGEGPSTLIRGGYAVTSLGDAMLRTTKPLERQTHTVRGVLAKASPARSTFPTGTPAQTTMKANKSDQILSPAESYLGQSTIDDVTTMTTYDFLELPGQQKRFT